ncbi:MAG: isoleucine--tRNA ligase [Bacteroidetes bacterium]|nr:isoleucine--tRNA ligase [Bacteroidota bacterium]
MKYNEYKSLNLPQLADEILTYWEANKIFKKSISTREGKTPFVFYEGPPSANGLPGIHHVMARAIKDIFCRYQTLKGKQVKRKAGWDTHGLPIELAVEKKLGITKEDIGKKISIDDYNKACRTEVMKYTDIWNDLTQKMGYWVDMEHPYITYENNYIESVWHLLKKLYDKELLYKGFTIQPYSPAAGTGLSTHELNQPGCYRDVKDRTAVAMFKIIEKARLAFESDYETYFLAWTTTPWTLPSNTALAVGKNIVYVAVKTIHPTSKNQEEIVVILAKDLLHKYFPEKNSTLRFEDFKSGDKNYPFQIIKEIKGSELEGIKYEQLLNFSQPTDGAAFRVVLGDFVTTEDGTGIVHIAPSFGSDDFRVAKQNGIGALTLVDKRGKFLPEVQDGVFLYGDEYVKEAYLSDEEKETEFQKQKKILEANGKIKELKAYLSVDERIVLKLQEEGKLFKKEIYEHSYPHCWRTDKPVLYYPLDSWFVKTTAMKDRMIELNKTINWKPESTGTGRFGNWLENLLDWNLSRSRYWGIPLPIWRSEDASEELIIGSIEELKNEIAKAEKIFGEKTKFRLDVAMDLHRPYVDDIILISPSGKKMFRETDLIDVWFDSGAMPYAQLHYPFENKELIDERKYFPADYIAEGVDQTRGWFFTLHAIATMCFDSVAFKNVISNGLVLDKNGNKMSKRLGNAVDPFETLSKYGPDATRWYMITNAQPWDNLKFDVEGIGEAQRKFFGTLFNTYSFFVLYANIDGFSYAEKDLELSNRPEIDRWILSELNTLIKLVDESYTDYEPTKAGRAIQYFVDEHLSNWYVRLCRRRFWKGEYTEDKISAYQTLYTCLECIAQLMSPIAPFFADKLFRDLNLVTNRHAVESVHLSNFPTYKNELMDKNLEERMELAQKISSMVLSIRKKENIRVRQPLNRIQIPILEEGYQSKIEAVKELILSEVNVKQLNFVTESDSQLVKNMKLNFKTLGKKYGKHMKSIQAHANENGQSIIRSIELIGNYAFELGVEKIVLDAEDVEIIPVDLPGWKVANEGAVTVALDITITALLKEEGIAREIINRIQNMRKEKGLDVTDRIGVKIQENSKINTAITNNLDYICAEILASDFTVEKDLNESDANLVDIDEDIQTAISIRKTN